MCEGGPSSAGEALDLLARALDFLNDCDVAMLPTPVQAEALRALERAEAKHTAARARMLAAFAARGGYEADGQGGARTWLCWQTRVTRGAAAGAVGWMRRLAAHPVIEHALAAGEMSASWAKQLCAWTDRLPEDRRGDADVILAGAARAGLGLAQLAGLAAEMHERSRPAGPDGGFDDRGLSLGVTIEGAGRVEGDLTPGCAAALSALLGALGKKAGPEDTRTAAQRRHDALAEACQRLIAAGMLPGVAAQPAHAVVHLTLGQLRGLPGASAAEAAWLAARSAEPGWLTGPEAAAAGCDASLAPVVTGHIDWAALDRLVGLALAASSPSAAPWPAASGAGASGPAASGPGAPRPLDPRALARLRRALLAAAADVMSGPGGLAAWLRTTQLDGPLGEATSGPLGAPPDAPVPLGAAHVAAAIPAHLRRAVLTRHRRCAFPGCGAPARDCHIHHLKPRARGGPTTLPNLAPLCPFHHLVVIHRWGWTLTLNPDGTTTATSPTGHTLHSHGPPGRVA